MTTDAAGALADLIGSVLATCLDADNRQALQREASQRKITFEQLVAAALTSAILESFEVKCRA